MIVLVDQSCQSIVQPELELDPVLHVVIRKDEHVPGSGPAESDQLLLAGQRSPGLMRPIVAVGIEEGIELGPRLREVRSGRSGGLQFQGEVHALAVAILLRVASLMRAMAMPSLSHHTANLDSPERALRSAPG
jgi:hypothetical protein